MNPANRVTSFPVNETARPQGFQQLVHNFIQQPVNDAAQPALGKTFRRWINRRDPSKMDSRVCGIILDNLELRVVHADPLATQTRFAKHDDALPGRNHFLHVMQVEPATHQRLA